MQSNTTGKSARYSICVSGAAAGDTVVNARDSAEKLGETIARHGHVLLTGATVGLPYFAAQGATKAKGMSVGFSPAVSFREHVRKYRLPHDSFDFISYTGLHYVGRDMYLVQSADAVITVGGRFGSLHEFTSALEAHKPCGVLLGSGGTADLIPALMQTLQPPDDDLVIFDEDPKRLVERIIEVLDDKNKDLHDQLQSDQEWYMKPAGGGYHNG